MSTEEVKKNTRKPSRTLLIMESKNSDYSHLVGLVNTSKTLTTTFLEFDTLENSVNAYNQFRKEKVRVKYCYYKLFVKFMVDISSLEYNNIKETIKQTVGGCVLYFKLYKKDNKLIGSGDMTVDTLSQFNELIKKKFETKVGDSDVAFELYRFRVKPRQT